MDAVPAKEWPSLAIPPPEFLFPCVLEGNCARKHKLGGFVYVDGRLQGIPGILLNPVGDSLRSYIEIPIEYCTLHAN